MTLCNNALTCRRYQCIIGRDRRRPLSCRKFDTVGGPAPVGAASPVASAPPRRDRDRHTMTPPPESRLPVWRLQQLERLAMTVVSADADLERALAALSRNDSGRVYARSYDEERSYRSINRLRGAALDLALWSLSAGRNASSPQRSVARHPGRCPEYEPGSNRGIARDRGRGHRHRLARPRLPTLHPTNRG